MTPEEKRKKYAYQKARRQHLNAEMRKAGIIGQPRPKMTPEERKAKRHDYSHNYNMRVRAEAKAWRELQEQQEKKKAVTKSKKR